MKDDMSREELQENLSVFEDEELLDLLGGDDAIKDLEDIPEHLLID